MELILKFELQNKIVIDNTVRVKVYIVFIDKDKDKKARKKDGNL